MNIGPRQFLGLVLVAIGLVTATAALVLIVDTTLLDEPPIAADVPTAPGAPDVVAGPPDPTEAPSAPASEAPDLTGFGEVLSTDETVDEPSIVVEVPAPGPVAPPVTTPVASPPVALPPIAPPVAPPPPQPPALEPEPAPAPDDSPDEPGTGAPPPDVQVPTTPPAVTHGCGRDGKPDGWPWVERAGNQGQGEGWGPPVGGCGHAHGQAHRD